MNDKRLSEQLRQGGLIRANEFSMRRLAEIYVEIYHRVLEREKHLAGSKPKSGFVKLFADRLLRKPDQASIKR